jgi:hypothetical protein
MSAVTLMCEIGYQHFEIAINEMIKKMADENNSGNPGQQVMTKEKINRLQD